MKHIDEDVFVEDFGDNVMNLVPSIFAERNIPVILSNLIDYEYKPFGEMEGAYKHVSAHVDEDGWTNRVFTHRYSTKWSRIIARVFSRQLSACFKCHTSSTITPSIVKIKILDKNIGI